MIDKTIRIEKSGGGRYWLAAWRDSTGERRRKSIGTTEDMSHAEARRAAAVIAEAMALAPAKRDAGRSPRLQDWLDTYYDLRDDIDDRTVSMHRTTGGYLVEHLGATTRLDRITHANADDWRAWLKSSKNLSEPTACVHVRTAKVIFARAVSRRQLGENPFTNLCGTAKAPRRDWRQFTEEEIQRLIDACPNAHWKALVGLCAWAGLRRGEALRLEWGDIHWTTNRIVVALEDGATESTKRRVREVLLEPKLALLLLACRDDAGEQHAEDGLVCPLSEDNLQRTMCGWNGRQGIIQRAGLSNYAKPFHTLRKHRATTWKQQYPEFVVDAWLGHSLEVSRAHYLTVPESYYG